MANLAINYCAKCGEVGGDKTGFSDHCIDENWHEPEIMEVSPPLDPTDVYVATLGSEQDLVRAFARRQDADQYAVATADPVVIQPVPVDSPVTAVETIGGQFNETQTAP